MSKSTELAKNTAIIAVGKISTQFLSFLLIPLYTSVLSPESYGFVDLAILYTGLLAPTLTMQMEMAVFRALIDERSSNSLEGKSETISSAVAVFGAGIATGAALLFLLSTLFDIKHGLIIILLFISLASIGLTLQISRGLGSNKQYSIASIIVGLTGIILNLLFLLILNMDAAGILLASTVSNIVGVIYLTFKMRIFKYIKYTEVSLAKIKSLLNYSWPLVPNHISLWGINGISRTIVSITLGIASVGIYAIASKLSLIYTSLYSIYAMSWTESASVHIKTKDNFFSVATDATVRLFGSLAILLISGISVFFPLLVADEFSSAKNLIPLLIIGGFLGSLETHYEAIYLAVRKTKEVAKVTLQALVISSVLTVALISHVGLYTPAIALVATYLYISVRRHFDVQQYVTIKYRPKTLPSLTVLALVATGAYHIDSMIVSTLSGLITLTGCLILNRNIVLKVVYKYKSMTYRKISSRRPT